MPKTFQQELEELNAALRDVKTEAGKSFIESSKIGILAKAGVDGKLTGGDVVVSVAALAFGLLASVLWGLAKLVDGYTFRDATGCAVDLMTVVVGAVVIRFLLDVLSLPSMLGMMFPDEPRVAQPAQVVRDPIIVNRPVKRSVKIALPNGEEIERSKLIQFLQAVEGREGKIWSREEWSSRGVSQKQWAGIKEMLERLGVWRDAEGVSAVREDFEK